MLPIAQVAVGGDGAEVDPRADVGVAQEPLVVLVGVAVHDAGFDLAADAAVGPDRHAAAKVSAKQVGIASDVAGSLNSGEGLDPDTGLDGDGAASSVEDGAGIYPCFLVDQQPLRGPNEGEVLPMGAVLTHPAAGGEVAGQVVGILGDKVPRPSNPLSPYLEALDLSSSFADSKAVRERPGG